MRAEVIKKHFSIIEDGAVIGRDIYVVETTDYHVVGYHESEMKVWHYGVYEREDVANCVANMIGCGEILPLPTEVI